MLKKILASAAFTAAAIVTLPAIAQEGPKLTDAEKATLKTYRDFQMCAKQGMTAAAQKAIPAVKSIVEARNKAGSKATIDAAKAAGMTEDQAKQVSEAMVEAEAGVLANMIMEGEAGPVNAKCAKDLKISNKDGTGFSDEYNKKLETVMEKMKRFFMQQEGAAPKPKGP